MAELYTRFDAVEFLRTRQDMAAYLSASLEESSDDIVLVLAALNDIARAQGMEHGMADVVPERTIRTQASPAATKNSIARASSTGNPEFATIMKVMKALGLRLHATAL